MQVMQLGCLTVLFAVHPANSVDWDKAEIFTFKRCDSYCCFHVFGLPVVSERGGQVGGHIGVN